MAYYSLDEGSGHLAHDRSGHGNHGKIRGARWERLALGGGLPTSPSSVRGRETRAQREETRAQRERCALVFDGEDDHVSCADPAVLDIRGPFTLSAWVMPSDVPTGERAIGGQTVPLALRQKEG